MLKLFSTPSITCGPCRKSTAKHCFQYGVRTI